jgi:hypothetical protein
VNGHWCGKDVDDESACEGDEVGYTELDESGTEVTGQFCEAIDTDCYDLHDGRFDGKNLTFQYSFSGNTVTGEFTLEDDTLKGTLHSTKCDCEVSRTLHRL